MPLGLLLEPLHLGHGIFLNYAFGSVLCCFYFFFPDLLQLRASLAWQCLCPIWQVSFCWSSLAVDAVYMCCDTIAAFFRAQTCDRLALSVSEGSQIQNVLSLVSSYCVDQILFCEVRLTRVWPLAWLPWITSRPNYFKYKDHLQSFRPERGAIVSSSSIVR